MSTRLEPEVTATQQDVVELTYREAVKPRSIMRWRRTRPCS